MLNGDTLINCSVCLHSSFQPDDLLILHHKFLFCHHVSMVVSEKSAFGTDSVSKLHGGSPPGYPDGTTLSWIYHEYCWDGVATGLSYPCSASRFSRSALMGDSTYLEFSTVDTSKEFLTPIVYSRLYRPFYIGANIAHYISTNVLQISPLHFPWYPNI